MTRRTVSLVTAGAVLFVLVMVSFYAPMPYVVMSPGLTENTLGSYNGTKVIQVKGHKTYPTSGHLDLTTVSVTSPDYSPKLAEVMQAWWDRDEIVIPRDIAYPPTKSNQQVERENKVDMTTSQDAAVAAALKQAGIPTGTAVVITAVQKDAPADGTLENGDILRQVDGVEIDSVDAAIVNISQVAPGDQVRLVVERNGKQTPVTLTTVPSPDDKSKSRIGVELGEDFDPPFDVKITLGEEIGGPSAGTMFALAIYDTITPGELTGGRYIAGTGTITSDGKVGEIGGIQQKIAGAAGQGATVFLVPAGDCSDAAKSAEADSVQLVKISTLDDAVKALEAIDAGDASSVPSCDES
jgi:PDZ domain-containing protein